MAASRSIVVGGSLRRGIKVDWGAVIVVAAASGADGVEIGKAEFVKAGKAAGRVVESGEVEDVGVVVVIKGEGHLSEKVELVKVLVPVQVRFKDRFCW